MQIHRSNLNAAVIGLGVGEKHITGFDSHAHCQVTVICDSNPEKLKEVSERHPNTVACSNANEVLYNPDIDVISIASYEDMHAEQVIIAVSEGKHVFVEKPLCLTFEELERVANCLNSHRKIRLSSNLILRKSPRFMDLKARIASGALGDIFCMEGCYDYGRIQKILNGWRCKINNYSVTGGGAIHLIDLLTWLKGADRVDKVFGLGNKICTLNSDFLPNDSIAGLISFTDGSVAKIGANFGAVTPHHHRVNVYGTSGTFEQNHLGAVYMMSRDQSCPKEILSDDYPGVNKGAIIPSFIDEILGLGVCDVGAQDVLDCMAVSLALDDSIRLGKTLEMKNFWFDLMERQ